MIYVKHVDSTGNYEVYEATGYRVDYTYPVSLEDIPVHPVHGPRPAPERQVPRVRIQLTGNDDVTVYLHPQVLVFVMNNEGKTIERIVDVFVDKLG
jgi:hypothetical protein